MQQPGLQQIETDTVGAFGTNLRGHEPADGHSSGGHYSDRKLSSGGSGNRITTKGRSPIPFFVMILAVGMRSGGSSYFKDDC